MLENGPVPSRSDSAHDCLRKVAREAVILRLRTSLVEGQALLAQRPVSLMSLLAGSRTHGRVQQMKHLALQGEIVCTNSAIELAEQPLADILKSSRVHVALR